MPQERLFSDGKDTRTENNGHEVAGNVGSGRERGRVRRAGTRQRPLTRTLSECGPLAPLQAGGLHLARVY